MNDHPPDQPTNDPTADRLRDAMQAQAASVQPADAWPTIVARLDGRGSPWTFVKQHPLVLSAGVVAVVLLAILTVNLLTGDEQAEDVDIVGPPSSEDFTLMAVTTDGRLVELDAAGNEIAVRSETFEAGPDGTPMAAPSQFEVSGEHPAESVQFLRSMPASDACAAGDQVMTGLDFESIEVPVDRELGPTIDPVDAFAYSRDGESVAYVVKGQRATDPPGNPRCRTGSRELEVVSALDFDHELSGTDIPDGLVVTELAWLDEERLVVVGHDDSGVMAADPNGLPPAMVFVVRPMTDISVVLPGSPGSQYVPMAIALDTRLAPAGDGEVLAAGHYGDQADRNPFDDTWDTGQLELDGPIEVWRGDPSTGTGTLLGSAAPDQVGISEAPTGTDAVATLEVLSVASSPDGGAYLTVGVNRTADAERVGAPEAALFRITPEGESELLAEDVVSVAVRPGATDVPEPVDVPDAGPVVGARPDGSLAFLDAATGAVDGELLAADEWPEANRPTSPEGEALLAEMAIDTDDLFTTRPLDPAVSGVECAEGEFQADWDVWRVPLTGDPSARLMVGGPDAEPWVLPPTAPPSRMPALSPDGSQIAYVTTSNGQRCDGALVVAVADLSSPTDVLTTHTLATGIEPLGLAWTADGRLMIQLVGGNDAAFPVILPVSVDPMVGGPVGFDESPVALDAPVELVASGDPEWLHLVGLSNDGYLRILVDEILTDVAHEEPDTVALPYASDEAAFTSLAADSAGAVWATVGLGQPVWPLTGFDSYRTFRWPLPTDGVPTANEQVSDQFVAVAATPFAAERTDAGEPNGTTVPVDTEPTGTTIQEADGPAFLYVTGDGSLVRRGVGGTSEVVAQLPPTSDGGGLAFGGQGVQLAATPDGETVYVALADDGGTAPTCSEGDLHAVDLASGEVTLLTDGRSPAVSPDGTRLAYSFGAENGDQPGQCRQSLAVLDLESGERTVWADGFAAGNDLSSVATISAIHWSADGEVLAFERQYEAGSGVFLADADAPEGVLDERAAIESDPVDGGFWSLAGVLPLNSDPAGLILLQPWCVTTDDETCTEVRLSAVDADGAVQSELAIDGRIVDAVVSPYGVVGFESCLGPDCEPYPPLWFQPLSGEAERVTDGEVAVEGWAWLP